MEDNRKKNSWKVTHGFWSKKFSWEKHKFYDLYCGIKARCNRKTHISYPNYGWRWIRCLWDTFEEFKKDMYDKYIEHIKGYWRNNTSIDRIDVNWNYCKENCKRSTRHEQRMNCRDTIRAIVDWVEYKTTDISSMCNITIDWAWDRIKSYNKWKITKKQLFRIWSRKKM